MQFHPVASIFPMMSVEEFKALKESIQARGQRNPIYTHEGKIVDGRNRYQVCLELGIQPRYEEWDGKGLLVDFVWDLNKERRHLAGGALKMAAGRYAKEHAEEAERNRLANLRRGNNSPKSFISPMVSSDTIGEMGTSRQKAAKKFGVGPATVQRAVAVLSHGIPELAQAVESGRVTVNHAAEIVKTYPNKEQQKEIVAQGFPKLDGKDGNGKIKSLGIGIERAQDAINCLRRIPLNDSLRKRAFQLVKEYIRDNE